MWPLTARTCIKPTSAWLQVREAGELALAVIITIERRDCCDPWIFGMMIIKVHAPWIAHEMKIIVAPSLVPRPHLPRAGLGIG